MVARTVLREVPARGGIPAVSEFIRLPCMWCGRGVVVKIGEKDRRQTCGWCIRKYIENRIGRRVVVKPKGTKSKGPG